MQTISAPEKRYGQSDELYLIELKLYSEVRRIAARHGAEQSEAILSEFENAFPESNKLQRLRYLIGQSYWVGGETEKARNWLSKVIEEDHDANTFYRDLAFRRLQHLTDLYEDLEVGG